MAAESMGHHRQSLPDKRVFKMSQNRPTLTGRTPWLVTGILAGICISYFLPHEPALAITNDRSENFALMTVPLSILDSTEGIFVLDFSTGRLRGAVLNSSNSRFTHYYQRDLIGDFQLNAGGGNPKFAFVGGSNPLAVQGGPPLASGVIYVAELTSGKVNAYIFPYSPTPRGPVKATLRLVDSFPFRDATFE